MRARPLRPDLEQPLFEIDTENRPGWVLAGFFVFFFLGLAFAQRVGGQTADDFFITYRYAQNLVAGFGFVFNPGEWVLGTTAPGWGLCLALLHTLTGIAIPELGSWTTGLFLAGIASLLLWEGARIDRAPEAFVGGLFLVTSIFFWSHNGFELYGVLLLLLFAARVMIIRPISAGVLAGFAVWARPDAGLVVAGLGGLLLVGGHRKELLRYLGASALVVVSGLVLAQLFYGSPLPGTLAAKRLQAAWLPETWASGLQFWPEGIRWIRDAYAGPRLIWLLGFGFPGWFLLFRLSSPTFQVLVYQGVVTLVAYPLLGVPFYTWYAIPVLMALIYGAVFTVGQVLRWLRAKSDAAWSWSWVAAVMFALLVLPLPLEIVDRTVGAYRGFQGMPRHDLYHRAGLWLEKNTSDQATVAFIEVGTVAYYSQRSVRDLLGLVSPESLPYVARGDLVSCFSDFPTDYFVTTTRLAGLLDEIVAAPEFADKYRPVTEIRNDTEALTIYARSPELPVSWTAPGNLDKDPENAVLSLL